MVHWRLRFGVAGGVAVLLCLRLYLPFDTNESMTVYDGIVWALLNQQNWGKQALVGALDYPPLPALVLLIFTAISEIVGINPGKWVVAVSQIWTLSYLVKLIHLTGRAKLFLLAAPILLILPALLAPGLGPSPFEFVWDTDPFWICIVPMAAIVFHVSRLERTNSLRDLVIVALSCGILVLCGITGILFSLMVLATVWLYAERKLIRRPGVSTLLFAPCVYVLLLYPFFNWLILGDYMFCIHRLQAYFLPRAILDSIHTESAGTVALPVLFILALVLMLVIHFFRSMPLAVRLSYNLAFAALISAAVGTTGQLFIGGEYLLAGFCWIAPMHLLVTGPGGLNPNSWRYAVFNALNVLLAAVLVASFPIRHQGKTREKFVESQPPPPDIIKLVDRHWDRSRILIYDLRTAVIYARHDKQRFWPRLDYYETLLREQMVDEQFHLLLAPDNGRFYAHGNVEMAGIHTKGKNWLFLEQLWPDGWQLWRCIRARPEEDEIWATP